MATVPPCRNPNHPSGIDRSRSMVILEEADERVIFACLACKEVEKILSVQVVTLPRGKERAKYLSELQGVKKAQEIKKNEVGKITYFH